MNYTVATSVEYAYDCAASLDTNRFFAYTSPVNRGSFGIRKDSALDAFHLFYEELISSKPAQNRIRRIRRTAPAK